MVVGGREQRARVAEWKGYTCKNVPKHLSCMTAQSHEIAPSCSDTCTVPLLTLVFIPLVIV